VGERSAPEKLNWASYGAVVAHVRIAKTASGEAASAAAIEVFAPTLLGYAGVGGLHPDDGPSVGPLADGVERD
jgi:hypothetical protein